MTRRLVTGLAAVLLTAPLVSACSSEAPPTDDATPAASSPAPLESATTPAPDDTTSPDDTAAPVKDVARAAIATALKATDGGIAYDYDLDSDDKFIEVAVLKGTTTKVVNIKLDGTTVIDTLDGESLSAEDLREVNAAKVTLSKAMKTALKARPGVIEGASLMDDGKALQWEIDFDDDAPVDEVDIDAKTGEVL